MRLDAQECLIVAKLTVGIVAGRPVGVIDADIAALITGDEIDVEIVADIPADFLGGGADAVAVGLTIGKAVIDGVEFPANPAARGSANS